MRVRVELRRGHVVVPQHPHAGEPEHRIAVLAVGQAGVLQRAIDRGREQHRAGRQRLAGLQGALQRDEGEVAAGRVADEHHLLGIDALRQQPAVGRVAVVGRGRKLVLGRKPVVGYQRASAEAPAQARREGRLGVGKAKGERSPVQIQDGAAGKAVGHAHPLRSDAIATDRLAHRSPINRCMACIDGLKTPPQRRQVVALAQGPVGQDAQQLVERAAAPTRRALDHMHQAQCFDAVLHDPLRTGSLRPRHAMKLSKGNGASLGC